MLDLVFWLSVCFTLACCSVSSVPAVAHARKTACCVHAHRVRVTDVVCDRSTFVNIC